MGEVSLSVSFPLDGGIFLRRECPSCGRQFKWRHSSAGEEEADSAMVEAYFCPYCHEPAAPDSWWTQEQVEYMRQVAATEVLTPQLQRFKRETERGNQPGSLFSINVNTPRMQRPEPLVEPDDMVRVDFPCHPEESLKVREDCGQDVSCIVCGIHYPVELVRVLPRQ